MCHDCIKMEFQKITNFLNTTSDDKDLPRFVAKKRIEVYDQSGRNHNLNKEIRIKTSMLRSNLCNFNDAYIVVKGAITLEGDNDAYKRNKNLVFIIEMNHLIVFLLILNLLNTKQVYRKKNHKIMIH